MGCPFKHFCGASCSNPSATHPSDGTAHIHANGNYSLNPGVSAVTAQNYTATIGEKGWE